MISFNPSRLARAAALCAASCAMVSGAYAANGDKSVYQQTKDSAKTAYNAAKTQCDASSGNAKDICVAEAKAVRTKAEGDAEVMYKNTAKSRERAAHETAEANYKVSKERCDDKSGNEKDVCVKEAKAVQTRGMADAKAMLKTSDARSDASKDKRQADYKVAAEKCDAMSGDAKSSCVSAAKVRYGM